MTTDVPNAFAQTAVPEPKKGKERVAMKVTGVLFEMPVQLNPALHGPHVVCERGRKVLCVQVSRAICSMSQSSLLWHKKFCRKLEQKGFKFNPCDPCVANKNVKESQHMIRIHVDDLVVSSHKNPKVNDKFDKWPHTKHSTLGKVKAACGQQHDSPGMMFDFRKKGKVKINMLSHVDNMLEEFSVKCKSTDMAMMPAAKSPFHEGQGKMLKKKHAKEHHTDVAKGLFVSKQDQTCIQLQQCCAHESRVQMKVIGTS